MIKRSAQFFAVLIVSLAGLKTTRAGGVPRLKGDATGVHDPCIIRDGKLFYVFCTGRGIPVRTSNDLFHWKLAGPVFRDLPAWVRKEFPTVNMPWAPDISFSNGEYRLYYAVSLFGKNTSAVGLMVNKTLDRTSPNYKWIDRGKVVETKAGDDWNAIDPNAAYDDNGNAYLFAGSFWTGIKLFKLDPKTGLRADPGAAALTVAARDHGDAIEAPFVIQHDKQFFFFCSFDLCCHGVDSTYNVVVARSEKIDGGYADRDGKPLLRGGADVVLKSDGDVRGPGHCAVLHYADKDWLINHFYDAARRGVPTLQIRPITWDKDGWPTAGEPIAGPVDEKGAIRLEK